MATVEEIESQLQQRKQQILFDRIESQLSARKAELSKTETPTPFFDQVGKTFLNNLLSAPSVAGQVLSQGVAGTEAALEGGASVLTGGDFDFERRANRNLELPGFAQLNAIPRPTVQGAEALFPAVRSAVTEGRESVSRGERLPQFNERFGPAFDEELARINQEEARIAEKSPFKVGAGEVGGDVLSLVAGRLPFARGINTAETAFVAKKFTDSMTNPGTRKIVELALDSKVMRSLKRGAGRAVETGAEAAILSILNDGDPLETAAFAAGGQMAGSALLNVGKGLLTGGPTKIGSKILLASASFGALIQMTKQTMPGGSPSELLELADSMSGGFEKVQFALALGALSTVAGAGRLRGGVLAESLPKRLDALATIPRAVSISLLEDYINATPDEQQTIDATLQQLQQDPEFFGPEITARLLKAMEDGNLTEALRK